ncbi:MAG: helix-turn-helix transcriptional regulator [Schumannella sp.]
MSSGKSQRELAKHLGLSQTSLWSFLNGNSGMGARTAANLARLGGVRVDDLFDGARRNEVLSEVMLRLDLNGHDTMGVGAVRSRLIEVMDRRSWTPEALAKAAVVSLQRVESFLGGSNSETKSFLALLAKTMGVPEEWLINGDPRDEDDVPAPLLKYRPDFAASLAIAQELRPQHGAYVWSALADSAPLVTVPITPALLVDLADVLVKYIVPPAKNSSGA